MLSGAYKHQRTARGEAHTIVDTRKRPEWSAKEHGYHTNAEDLYASTGEVDHHELHR